MSEYDFLFEPLTKREIKFRVNREELEDFANAIDYKDMLILKEYISKNKRKFSKYLKYQLEWKYEGEYKDELGK